MHMSIHREQWQLARAFKISRSTMHVALPVVVELHEGPFVGRGECEAHESDEHVIEQEIRRLYEMRPTVERPGFTREALQKILSACPIRNAIDCALWDLDAKRTGAPAWHLAGLDEPRPLTTVYTISVDEPRAMAEQAAPVRHLPVLKLKLSGEGDVERVTAVRRVAPDCRLTVDANEAWALDQLQEFAPRLSDLGVELIEQPLPRGRDSELADYRSPIPLCADETCLDCATLADVIGKYQFINIKLDKTGGLTEAIHLYRQATAHGLRIMVGCMVGTSLAMAPAMLIARYAEYVDLDGPLLLERDRSPGLMFSGATISPPSANVWG